MNSYMVHFLKNKLIVFVQVPLFFSFLHFSAEYSKHIVLENTKLYTYVRIVFYYKYGMYYG